MASGFTAAGPRPIEKGPSGAQVRVAVVVLSWNAKRLLGDCLVSLRKTNYPHCDVLVVDNGSTDGSAEYVRQKFPDVDLLSLPDNVGFSIGNNAGIKYAIAKHNPDYIVLLSNDTLIVQPNWLFHMVSVARLDAKIGVVNCRYVAPGGSPQIMGLRLLPGVYLQHFKVPSGTNRSRDQSSYVHETDVAGGACFLISRALVDAIGFLDEGYSPAYFEDVDYCERARNAGFRVIHDGQVTVVHVGAATSKRLPTGYMAYVMRRNLFRFMRTHHPRMMPFILVIVFFGSFLRAAGSARERRSLAAFVVTFLTDLRATGLALIPLFSTGKSSSTGPKARP